MFPASIEQKRFAELYSRGRFIKAKRSSYGNNLAKCYMKVPLIMALLAVYVLLVLARFGGHYVHVLPVAAVAVYIYGLFTFKSAGVSSDIDSSSSSSISPDIASPADEPLTPLAQTDQNRNLHQSD
jgi:hypothetical protein